MNRLFRFGFVWKVSVAEAPDEALINRKLNQLNQYDFKKPAKEQNPL